MKLASDESVAVEPGVCPDLWISRSFLLTFSIPDFLFY